jgi:hypothetical protein
MAKERLLEEELRNTARATNTTHRSLQASSQASLQASSRNASRATSALPSDDESIADTLNTIDAMEMLEDLRIKTRDLQTSIANKNTLRWEAQKRERDLERSKLKSTKADTDDEPDPQASSSTFGTGYLQQGVRQLVDYFGNVAQQNQSTQEVRRRKRQKTPPPRKKNKKNDI